MNIRAIVLVSLVLAGCGPGVPVYRTTYNYVPPAQETGRSCVLQCENTRMQCSMLQQQQTMMCQQQASMAAQQCNQQADMEYSQCLAAPGHRYCFRRTCNEQECASNEQMCVDQYNRCFQTCGGQVQPVRECTANCETAVRP